MNDGSKPSEEHAGPEDDEIREFPRERHRWNTNEEICNLLSAFSRHASWLATEVRHCPPSGSMVLYSRSEVKNHTKDGYWWKKRKDGKTTREDHMKLKVKGVECIYGKYSHSLILPTFHRRCYWLLQRPDVILVHYLNVYTEDTRVARLPVHVFPKHVRHDDEPDKEQLKEQLRPMFHSQFAEKDPTAAQLLTDQRVTVVMRQILGLDDPAPEECHCHENRATTPCKDKPIATTSRATSATAPHPIAPNGSRHQNHQNTSLAGQAAATLSNVPVLVNLSQLQSFMLSGGQSLQILGSLQNLPANEQISQLNSLHQSTINNQCENTLSGQQNLDHVLTTNNFDTQPNGNPQMPNGNPHYQRLVSEKDSGLQAREERVLISPTREVRDDDVIRSRGLSPTVQRCATSALVNQFPLASQSQQQSSYYQNVRTDHLLNADNGYSNNFNPENSSYHENHSVYADNQTGYPENHAANYPETNKTFANGSNFAEISNFAGQNLLTDTGTGYNDQDSLGLDNFDFLDLDLDNLVDSGSTLDTTDLFETKASEFVNKTDFCTKLEPSNQQSSSNELQSMTSAQSDHVARPAQQQQLNQSITSSRTITMTSPAMTSAPQPMTSVARTIVTSSAESAAVTKITDFSPEWAYTEGGTKLLVTGPWYSSNTTYTVIFDRESVPAELVQNGVLRCVCPAHAAGTISFQVACDDQVISNSCQFDYKNRSQTPKSEHKLDEQTQWLTADDKLFKLSMLERMADIEKNLFQGRDTGLDRPFQMPKITSQSGSSDVFEDCMVAYCQACSKLKWLNSSRIHTATSSTSHKGMTLLHLASALGYVTLMRVLLSWREEKPSAVLEYEVDALSLDDNSCTPFFWACALNKLDAAVLLYEFNPSALNVCTRDGTLPLTVARFKEHNDLVSRIESLSSRPHHSTPKYTRLGGALGGAMGAPRVRGPRAEGSQGVRGEMRKRLSMELFPQVERVCESDKQERKTLRTVSSQPVLTSLDTDISSIEFDTCDVFMTEPPIHVQAMDTDEVLSGPSLLSCESPIIDVEKVSSDDETPTGNQTSQTDDSSSSGSSQNQMVTLAKQIIAAMPERIKLSPSRSDDSGIVRDRSSSYGSRSSVASSTATPPCSLEETALAVETFQDYRYSELSTPASSLSPASSSCLHSPLSFTLDSPPPTTSEFQEYFNAPQTYMEKDFSQLTLSDQEQRRLYEAAKIIQNFYRRYKDRYKQQLQRKQTEIEAAVLIQSYYRRYKEYAYYKKMCQAAVLIQSQFRSYQVQKRYKRSRDAATIIQNQYRAYKEYERFKKSRDAAKIIQQRFRSHYQRSSSQEKTKSRKVVHPLCRQSSHGSEKESGTTKDDKTANESEEPETSTNQEREAASRDEPQPISSDDSS